MSSISVIILTVFSIVVFIILLFMLASVRKLKITKKRVSRELGKKRYNTLPSVGSVNSLSIIPLVDYYSGNASLKTEAGVSYLVKADKTTILLDIGSNSKKEHPSPLLHNMNKLGIKMDDVDMIFISHIHMDHIGGIKEQRTRTFSISQGKVEIDDIPVYAPARLSSSKWNPGPKTEVVKEPKVIKPGITSIGVIPRALFLIGRMEEHSLAINVKGRGIVLIIGCGHQSIERIIERTKMLFDEPIYGIIGGLHYPLKGGRMMVGPINVQQLVGTDRPPWRGLNENDINNSILAIKKENPSIMSLSAHDSSDWAIDQFKNAFKDNYVDLLVGEEITI